MDKLTHKDTIQVWYEGVQYFDNGDVSNALQHFTSIDEPSAKILFNIGHVEMAQYQFEEAEQHFLAAVERDSHMALAHFQLGMVYYHLQRYNDSRSSYDRARNSLRGNKFIDYRQLGFVHKLYECEVLYNLALTYATMMNSSEYALELLHEASRVSVDTRQSALIKKAQTQLLTNQLFEPIVLPGNQLFRPPQSKVANLKNVDYLGKAKVISALPESSSSNNNNKGEFKPPKDPTSPLNTFQPIEDDFSDDEPSPTAFASGPSSPNPSMVGRMTHKDTIVIWHEGVLAFEKGDLGEALNQMNGIVDPSAKILYNIGVLQRELGQFKDALVTFKEVVSKDPHLSIGHFQLGIVLAHLHRHEESWRAFEMTHETLRGNKMIDYKQLGLHYKLHKCEVLHNEAWTYFELDRKDLASKLLNEAKSCKAEPRHDRIDDSVRVCHTGYAFQLLEPPKVLLFKPPKSKIDNLDRKDYLGKAKIVAKIPTQRRGSSTPPASASNGLEVALASPRSKTPTPTSYGIKTPEAVSFKVSPFDRAGPALPARPLPLPTPRLESQASGKLSVPTIATSPPSGPPSRPLPSSNPVRGASPVPPNRPPPSSSPVRASSPAPPNRPPPTISPVGANGQAPPSRLPLVIDAVRSARPGPPSRPLPTKGPEGRKLSAGFNVDKSLPIPSCSNDAEESCNRSRNLSSDQPPTRSLPSPNCTSPIPERPVPSPPRKTSSPELPQRPLPTPNKTISADIPSQPLSPRTERTDLVNRPVPPRPKITSSVVLGQTLGSDQLDLSSRQKLSLPTSSASDLANGQLPISPHDSVPKLPSRPGPPTSKTSIDEINRPCPVVPIDEPPNDLLSRPVPPAPKNRNPELPSRSVQASPKLPPRPGPSTPHLPPRPDPSRTEQSLPTDLPSRALPPPPVFKSSQPELPSRPTPRSKLNSAGPHSIPVPELPKKESSPPSRHVPVPPVPASDFREERRCSSPGLPDLPPPPPPTKIPSPVFPPKHSANHGNSHDQKAPGHRAKLVQIQYDSPPVVRKATATTIQQESKPTIPARPGASDKPIPHTRKLPVTAKFQNGSGPGPGPKPKPSPVGKRKTALVIAAHQTDVEGEVRVLEGDLVSIIAEEGDWLQVEVKGQKGRLPRSCVRGFNKHDLRL